MNQSNNQSPQPNENIKINKAGTVSPINPDRLSYFSTFSQLADGDDLPSTLWLNIRTAILTNEDSKKATDAIIELIDADRNRSMDSLLLDGDDELTHILGACMCPSNSKTCWFWNNDVGDNAANQEQAIRTKYISREESKVAAIKAKIAQTKRIMQHDKDVWGNVRNESYLLSEIKDLHRELGLEGEEIAVA